MPAKVLFPALEAEDDFDDEDEDDDTVWEEVPDDPDDDELEELDDDDPDDEDEWDDDDDDMDYDPTDEDFYDPVTCLPATGVEIVCLIAMVLAMLFGAWMYATGLAMLF